MTGSILPLAYGVVDSKNDISWIKFFDQLKNAIGEHAKICVVLNWNEGIIQGCS